MRLDRGIRRRLSRTFLVQALAISVAAVVSVYLAAAVIKRVLVTEALRMEASYFWEQRVANPAFPPPRTRNLSGYLLPGPDAGRLPAYLAELDDGFHDVPAGKGFTTAFVTRRDGQTLYLLFDGERVNELATYFGLVPLAVVLLALYLSVWLAYRASQRAVSPITRLAQAVNRLDPDTPDAAIFSAAQLSADEDEEVVILATALQRFTERLAAFVDRERHFTRDVSHELRTPLTVIRVASDMLLERPGLPGAARTDIARIRRSATNMEELVEAFLLLARESERGLPQARVCINDLVEAELDQLQLIARDKPVKVAVHAACRLTLLGPEQALSALLGNLLRNAYSYTEAGEIHVTIEPGRIAIADSGIGMDAERLRQAFEPFSRGDVSAAPGHGVGLTIVKRFSDRFGWPLEIHSEPGTGTRVAVDFPGSRCEPLAGQG
jgi:signal transduction histidine kinase